MLSTHNVSLRQAVDQASDLDNPPPDVSLKPGYRSLQPRGQPLWSQSRLRQLSELANPPAITACGARVLKRHTSIGKVDYPQLVTNNKIIML